MLHTAQADLVFSTNHQRTKEVCIAPNYQSKCAENFDTQFDSKTNSDEVQYSQ
jgi:hypothetical protein